MILCVLGRRGCGKTTLIKTRLRQRGRVLIFDSLSEYHDVAEARHSVTDFLDDLIARKDGLFRLALVPLNDNLDEAFNLFARAAWSLGDVTVVIDEIDAVASPVSIPEPLARILRYGRHRSISLIGASRRASEIPRLLTSQADEIVSFNQSEPVDLQYLAKSPAGASFAERVAMLPRFRYETWVPWGDSPESA